MEENVALDSKKQKKFVKSIKGIQKLIKKNAKIGAKPEPKKENDQAKTEKPFSMRLKDGKIKKRKRKERGLVYLSHIPHGFYEHQMTEYFKQFGVVTNARVIKSQRTGNSKGFAFVEFKEPSVAQIVAETMNNYLMGKRLIKAAYIPPEKQKRRAFRKHWNAIHNPTSVKRLNAKKAFNADKDEAEELKKAKKLLARYHKTQKALSNLGITYEFTPVDVPEVLLDKIVKKEKEDSVKEENETKIKKEEQKDSKKAVKKDDGKQANNKKANKTNKNEIKIVQQNGDKKANKKEAESKPTDKKKLEKKTEIVPKVNNKDKPIKVDKVQQKEKEQKLKDAGVKSMEEFISLEAEDSDESCDFDSDEYERMLEQDDEDSDESEASDDEQESDDDEEVEDEEENDESEEEVPAVKKGKGKPLPQVIPKAHLKRTNQQLAKKQEPQKQQQQKQQPQKQQPQKQHPQKQQPQKQQPQKQQPQKQQPQKQQPQKEQPQKQQPQKQQQQPPKQQPGQQKVKKQEAKTNQVKRKAPQTPPTSVKKPKFEKQKQKPMTKQFKKK